MKEILQHMYIIYIYIYAHILQERIPKLNYINLKFYFGGLVQTLQIFLIK